MWLRRVAFDYGVDGIKMAGCMLGCPPFKAQSDSAGCLTRRRRRLCRERRALVPEIVEDVRNVQASGEVIRCRVRFAGFDSLAQQRVREGMDEVQCGRNIDRCIWGGSTNMVAR